MIKIYGSTMSTASRCLWLCEEAGITHETIPVDFQAQEHKSPEFLKLNPNGKIPVMIDGDFTLWESLAINEYLARKFKPELLGATAGDQGQVLQWTYFSAVHLTPWIGIPAGKKYGRVPATDVEAYAMSQLERYMPVLNDALEGRTFIVGEAFTTADIALATTIASAAHAEIDLTAYPNLTRYMSEMMARPAMLKVRS